MQENRPPLWRTFTRLAIAAGPALAVAALTARWMLPGLRWGRATGWGVALASALLCLGGLACNAGWVWRRLGSRRVRVALNVWAQVVLSLLLLLLLNAIVGMTPHTRAWQFDLTHTGRHSISNQTRRILDTLERPVRLTLVVADGLARYGPGTREAVPLAARVRATAELYAAAAKVELREVDYDRDKAACLRLQTEINDHVLPNSVLVQQGGRHESVAFDFMLKRVEEGARPDAGDPVAFNIEARLTEAILRVAEPRRGVVYFLSGHGERAPQGNEREALNEFTAFLRNDNYDVRPLALTDRDAVPEDCDVLVITTPRTPAPERELDLIRAYLKRGGGVFALLGAGDGAGDTRGLTALLAEFNASVLDDELIWELHVTEAESRKVVQPLVLTQTYGRHPITDDLKTLLLRAEYASPVGAATDLAANRAELKVRHAADRYRVTPLAFTGDFAWTKKGRAAPTPEELRAPVTVRPVAVAVQTDPAHAPDGGGPRLVVCGSELLVADGVIGKYLANRVFAVNAVSWLARREYKLGIPAQSSDVRPLALTAATVRLLLYGTAVGMPLAAACVGAVVWWRRRRS